MEPRLAAILVADIAGYTRLMEAYEFGTHRRLSTLREETIASALKDLRGCVIKHTGDGFIAVFVSVNDAVRCAIRIQQAVHKCERDIPAEQRIRFRMGVNVGDVIIDVVGGICGILWMYWYCRGTLDPLTSRIRKI